MQCPVVKEVCPVSRGDLSEAEYAAACEAALSANDEKADEEEGAEGGKDDDESNAEDGDPEGGDGW